MMSQSQSFKSFAEFYPFYLSEHSDPICRRLHFLGTTLVLLTVLTAILTAKPQLLILAPILGYGAAWTGHFFFEKNKPATFEYPFYSLLGDFVMYKDTLTGKIAF